MFGRDYHIYKFQEYLDNGERFIIVRGARWSGKSYFIQNALEKSARGYIYIDVKKLRNLKSGNTLFERLKRDMYNNKISMISNIHDWSFIKHSRTFVDFFEKIDNEFSDTVIALDHADFLHRNDYYTNILSGVIDNFYNITLVLVPLSTSKLEKIIAVNDPSSPFFGRDEVFINIEYFDANTSIEFLKNKLNNPSTDEIMHVYETIGGSPVWLKKYVELRNEGLSVDRALKNVSKSVREAILSEIGNSKWNLKVLKTIAKYTIDRKYINNETIYEELECSTNSCRTMIKRSLSYFSAAGYIHYLSKDLFTITLPIIALSFL